MTWSNSVCESTDRAMRNNLGAAFGAGKDDCKSKPFAVCDSGDAHGCRRWIHNGASTACCRKNVPTRADWSGIIARAAVATIRTAAP